MALAEFERVNKLMPKEVLNYAITKYNVSHFVGLFSGGKDSYLTCKLAHQAIREIDPEIKFDVLHCYTGTGSHETFEYVLKICEKEGWHLNVEFAGNDPNYPQNAYMRVLHDKGFLGRGWHAVWLRVLKLDGMRRYFKNNPDAWFVSGKSPNNSKRRKAQLVKWMKRGKTIESLFAGIDDGLPSVKPMFFLTKKDTWKMIRELGLEIMDSYNYVGSSKECLCPAFATLEELAMLKRWSPTDAIDIEILNEQYGGYHKARDKRGRYYRKNFGKWGQPPKGATVLDENQEQLEDLACFECSTMRLNKK